MRVLVTGTTGLVGGAIAERLVAVGFDVMGLARRPGHPAASYSSIQADIGLPGVANRVAAAVGRCDAIVHAAATMGRDSDATSIIGTNCLGTQQMLSVAGRWTSTCFVYVSSIGVIGSPRELPITEEHPTMPLTAYHASKLFGEHLARVADSDQTSTVALRLTSPVGVGMPWDRIFSTFTRRALAGDPLVVAGTGGRRQDYVDVSDVAAAVELCLRKTASGIYNIASGSSISNIDLARKCVETLGSSSRIEAGADADPQEELRWDVSTERAKQMLGYAPRVELAQTIRAIAEEHARSAHC